LDDGVKPPLGIGIVVTFGESKDGAEGGRIGRLVYTGREAVKFVKG